MFFKKLWGKDGRVDKNILVIFTNLGSRIQLTYFQI